MRTMTAVLAKPGEPSQVVEIEAGSLDQQIAALHRHLDGYFDVIRLDRELVAYVNDEGLLQGLPWNRQLGPNTFTCGPIVALAVDPNSGESRGLSPAEVKEVQRLFDEVAQKMAPTPASIAGLEVLIGQAARRISFNGVETCTRCSQVLEPRMNGFCPKCNPPPKVGQA